MQPLFVAGPSLKVIRTQSAKLGHFVQIVLHAAAVMRSNAVMR